LLTAAYLAAFALFQLPLGVLLDRYGPRKVQAGLLGIAALGCFGFALAPDFLGLFAARAVIGLGFSAGLMASYKSSATWVPLERRSLANTAIMSAGALGVVVATEPTESLVALIGWRQAFLVFGVVILLAALLILAAAPRRDTNTAPAPLRLQVLQMLAILKTPLFWRIAPLLGLTSGVQIGIQTLWAGPWLRDVTGFSREEVARHLLYMAVAFMIGILSVGVIADRLGRRGIGPLQAGDEVLAGMCSHWRCAWAGHAPDHAALGLDPGRLVGEAHVADHHAGVVEVRAQLDLGSHDADPEVRVDRAPPLSAEQLRELAVAGADLGDLGLLEAALPYPGLVGAHTLQQHAQHVADRVSERHAVEVVLPLQNRAHGVLAGAGVAREANQAGLGHASSRTMVSLSLPAARKPELA
jgi:hypothetical protein